MLKNFVKIFGGDPNKKTIEQFRGIAEHINSLESQIEALSDDALRAKTDEFRARIAEAVGNVDGLDERQQFKAYQDALEEILSEAFAVVREASKRTIGLRHFDVQMIGGIALHRGSIAEMRTGEGKTLVATLPVYLNALLGRGIHLVTVNDYLARRDARWMAPIYHMLGLSVGVLQMAAVTENGKKAFLVDFERESPHEDQRHLRMVDRHLAYEGAARAPLCDRR
jgi:preprotein translocase subunit SecA